jgi:hypothetical protein
MMLRAPFLLFVFLLSFGIFIYLERPLYSSLPLASLITYGAIRVTQPETHLRGRRRLKYGKAREIAESERDPIDKGIKWGGITLPSALKNLGFFFMGAQGSGKSVSLQMLMYQAFIEDPEACGVVHDYKMELHAFLRWAGVPKEEIKIMNPYDRRCAAWDIQKDCIDKATAAEIAIGFIPPNTRESAPFFRLGWTFVFRDVLRFFMYETDARPGFRWDLSDVLAALSDKETLAAMFRKYPKLSKSVQYVERDNDDILTTLYTHTDLIEPIAGLWKHSKEEPVSFRDWRRNKRRQILILGNDSQREDSIQRLNAVLCQQMMKATVDNSVKTTRDTWFFLDEFHAINRIYKFESFINTVRSYRGNVVIATQDINQLFRPESYGEQNTNSIIQGCASKAILQCTGDAAKWAETQIGQEEKKKKNEGTSGDGHRFTRSSGTSEGFSPTVMKEEIEKLRGCSMKSGLDGFYLSSVVKEVYRCNLPFEEFEHVWPTPKIEPDFDVETSASKQEVDPFTPDELKELGLLQEEKQEQAPGQKQDEKEGQRERPKKRFRSSFDK